MTNDNHLSFKTTDETNSQLYLREITFMLDMGECLPFIKTISSIKTIYYTVYSRVHLSHGQNICQQPFVLKSHLLENFLKTVLVLSIYNI